MTGPTVAPRDAAFWAPAVTRLDRIQAVNVTGRRLTGPEQGFGYGTLPGHPESGEECFLVRLTPEGDVVYEILVFFRLASPMARLGGPVSLLLQRAATGRYVAAIRRATRGGTGTAMPTGPGVARR